MTFAENWRIQIEANRREAYTQLAGQKAELLLLLQQLANAHDKGTIYQGRAVQSLIAAKESNQRRPAPRVEDVDFRESYQAEAIQQERNAERFNDEVVTCSQKSLSRWPLFSFPSPPTSSWTAESPPSRTCLHALTTSWAESR